MRNTWAAVSDEAILLSNTEGTITAHGPDVLVCDCPGDSLDLAVQRVSTFALVAAAIITAIVAARAAPWPILLISTTWATGALGARLAMRRRRRLHGLTRLDFERGEVIQEGRGFRRRFPTAAIAGVSTPFVAGEATEREAGLAPRWLLLHLANEQSVRLGKGPAYALGPTLAFLKRAGVTMRA